MFTNVILFCNHNYNNKKPVWNNIDFLVVFLLRTEFQYTQRRLHTFLLEQPKETQAYFAEERLCWRRTTTTILSVGRRSKRERYHFSIHKASTVNVLLVCRKHSGGWKPDQRDQTEIEKKTRCKFRPEAAQRRMQSLIFEADLVVPLAYRREKHRQVLFQISNTHTQIFLAKHFSKWPTITTAPCSQYE